MGGVLSHLYKKLILQIFGKNKKDIFIDHVFEGEYTIDVQKMKFFKIIKAQVGGLEFCERILTAPSSLETVILMNEHFPEYHFKEALDYLENIFKKDDKLTTALEEKGDIFSKNLDFKKALRCYNLAAKFAPMGSSCFERIYTWRALHFGLMNKSQEYSTNIDLAISASCTAGMKSHLLDIKENMANKEVKESTNDLLQYQDKIIFTIQGQRNPNIPSGFEGLRINSNDTMGRYLTTDSELRPGTTVIVEDPYLAISNNSTRWDTTHCSNCLKKVLSTIPCESCVFVSYCSEECRLEDMKTGHQYECKVYPHLHALRVDTTLHLSLNAICKEGPEKLFKRWKGSTAKCNDDTKNDRTGIAPKSRIYYSDSYDQILSLKSHVDLRDLPTIAWVAVSISKALDYKTDFFKKSTELDNPDFKIYVASLFLHHGLSFPFNVVSLNEDTDVEVAGGGSQLEYVETFTAVYSLVSLMCHSCDATVFRQNLPNGRMAIITNRKLMPGDEICLSYGFEFITDEILLRRQQILEYYYFECQCGPCSLKWPTHEEMKYERKYLCSNCSHQNRGTSIAEASQCALTLQNRDLGFCKNCKTWSHLRGLRKQVRRIENLLDSADALLNENKPIEAIPLLIESIEFLQTHLAPPYKSMISAQLSLVTAYYLITNS